MTEFRWHFNETRPCDKAREPIQGEFFAADAISDPGEALVREGIQNSLDARRNGEKVRVRIRVSGQNAAVPRKAVAPYLDGLECHLRAPGNGGRDIADNEEVCCFLVFEDFRTTGLVGDASLADCVLTELLCQRRPLLCLQTSRRCAVVCDNRCTTVTPCKRCRRQRAPIGGDWREGHGIRRYDQFVGPGDRQ
jgi:hypothetical protein